MKAAGKFSAALIAWQRRHGRHDLPWQNTRDPYRIWLSEIMLQQTQVATVIPYYERFLERFPQVSVLAAAELDEVLKQWSGLGYYSRARNLHAAAKEIVRSHGGSFPRTRMALESLPGIGRSTAAAIAAFAFGKREAILDGNVKRVLARCFAVSGYPGDKKVGDQLWKVAESLLPDEDIEAYTQGLMDIGATRCTRQPECGRCPLNKHCQAHIQGRETAYPSPKPKKPTPTRPARLLILTHNNTVMLVRRPPAGVWANLWCFPEVPADALIEPHCRAVWGVELNSQRQLAPIRHALTHFTMQITATMAAVSELHSIAQSSEARWVPLAEASSWALPTPIRSLLAELT